jgi:hypothetical protein
MRRASLLTTVVTIALVMGGCGDDTESSPPSSSTSTPSTTAPLTTPPSSSTSTTAGPISTTTTTTTTLPAPVCESDGALAVVAEAIAAARLPETAEWPSDPAASPFAERTTTADEYAARLGLDCGLLVAADDGGRERLAIVAWTGPRMAYAIQSTDTPTEPYRPEAFVRNPVTEERGEFLADDMTLWAATATDGESILLGHVDFSLGAASKDWDAAPRMPFEEEINLPSEQHAIDALHEAGMRKVGIAQPPEIGSEEGYAQFVSPSGQISVADVAPTGWFDPMLPRYYLGETSIQAIDGVDVRVTLANPDDNLGFTRAAEVAFACDDYVWILEPPFNGTMDEMIDTATAIVNTEECRA